jgi:hypothetical protein
MTSHERSVWYFSITQVHIYYLLLRFCATPKTPYEYLEIVSGFTQHGAVGARRFGPRSYWSLTSAWLGHLGLSHTWGTPQNCCSLGENEEKPTGFWGQNDTRIGLERQAQWKSLECCCDMFFFSWCLPDWTFAAAFTRPKECVAHSFRHMSISYGSRSRSTLSNTSLHKSSSIGLVR